MRLSEDELEFLLCDCTEDSDMNWALQWCPYHAARKDCAIDVSANEIHRRVELLIAARLNGNVTDMLQFKQKVRG